MEKFFAMLIISMIVLLKCSESSFLLDEFRTKLLDVKKKCIVETNATEEIHAQIKRREPNLPREGKCYKACVMKGIGMLEPDTQFARTRVLDTIKALIGPEEFKLNYAARVIDDCNKHNETDFCEAGFVMCNCVFDHKNFKLFKEFI